MKKFLSFLLFHRRVLLSRCRFCSKEIYNLRRLGEWDQWFHYHTEDSICRQDKWAIPQLGKGRSLSYTAHLKLKQAIQGPIFGKMGGVGVKSMDLNVGYVPTITRSFSRKDEEE